MSDFFENEQAAETKEEALEESSIFTDPAKHEDKRVAVPKKKRLRSLISAGLAVVILAVGTFAVIKLIPEKEEEEQGTETPSIEVVSYETDEIESVKVTDSNGTVNFLSKREEVVVTAADEEEGTEEETEIQTNWYMEGYDPDVCSTSRIEDVVAVVAKLSALMTTDKKTPAECGFDAPAITAQVKTREDGEYTLYVGDESPDGSGTYVMTTKNDTIYIVETYTLSDLTFSVEDFAEDSYITAATFKTDVSEYKDDEGNLTTFDYVKLSGKNYPTELVIVPNTDAYAQYIYYSVTSPMKRYADNVGDITTMFTTTTTVAAGYTYDISEASLKKYGLDNPDVVVTLSVAGEVKTFKISKVDDNYCAVVTDESKNIKKVATAYIDIVNSKASDFYYAPVAIYSVLDLANYSVTTGGETYSFDVTVNEEDAEIPYGITRNGEEIEYEYFKNFYYSFVGLTCSDFGTEKLSAAPDTTVKLTFYDGRQPVEIKFTKYSATKYQYSIDGVDMGRITSSSYNKFIKNLKLVAENKEVKE
ncbi:MAG: DUF4340 domain-containing protein [Clostridia bacterium]|nr:DUF4340 domain-containing protein [Clostridia bacterium]